MSLGAVLAGNAVSATVLCALVALVVLRVKRPALVHALWLAVLLDLLVPPVLPVDLLPSDWSASSAVVRTAGSASTRSAPTDTERPSTIVLLWVAGSLTILALAIRRGVRLSRALERSASPVEALEPLLARHALSLGLKRVPRLRVVAARISPLVLPRFGGSEIVVPRDLLARLEPREIEAILVHELTHVRRRDPWVRLVELLATIVFWWHPVVYAARAALRRAEEACCDERVVSLLPGHAPDYALGLVKTLEFLSTARERPVWATGAAPAPTLARRLHMILDRKTSPRLSGPAQLALAGLIVAALVVVPVSGGRAEDSPAPTPVDQKAKQMLEQKRLALEREREALERARAELDAAREAQGDGTRSKQIQDKVRAEVKRELERAAAEGAREGVDVDRQKLDLELERAVAEGVRGAVDIDREKLERALETLELDRTRTETERAAVLGAMDGDREKLEREIVEAELAHRERALGLDVGDVAAQNEELRAQVEQLKRRVQELERKMARAGAK
jgi:beta-lactamase regulating signal transducer with metallopeptidase domain